MKASLPDEPRPPFRSARLRAEPVLRRHAQTMERVLADERIYTFLAEAPPSRERLERQYEFLEGGTSPDGSERWLTWILQPLDEGTDPVGFAQATVREPETVHVAYALAPQHWKRGYGREALGALLDLVFEHYRIERAIAEMDTRNAASIALVESLGFRRVRTALAVQGVKGTPSDEHVYELERSAWAARR